MGGTLFERWYWGAADIDDGRIFPCLAAEDTVYGRPALVGRSGFPGERLGGLIDGFSIFTRKNVGLAHYVTFSSARVTVHSVSAGALCGIGRHSDSCPCW